MTALPPIPDRVAAGVAWLDAHAPKDWPWLVQLHDFDMGDACRCVVGWTFADRADPEMDDDAGFHFASRVYELDGFVPAALGFDAATADDGLIWSALADEWRLTIVRLRAERAEDRDRFDEYVDGLLAEIAQLDAPACPHGSDPAVCCACDDEARDAAGYRKWDETHEMGADNVLG